MDRLSDRRAGLGQGRRLGAPPPPPTTPFRAGTVALALPAGWTDATTYQIAGPVADGVPHAITATSAPHDGRPLALVADEQVRATLDALPAGALLLRDTPALDGGVPAIRAVFRWAPAPGQVRYQQQLMAVVGGRLILLAAAFTARSRRALGPEVHRIMLSLAVPAAEAPAYRR